MLKLEEFIKFQKFPNIPEQQNQERIHKTEDRSEGNWGGHREREEPIWASLETC